MLITNGDSIWGTVYDSIRKAMLKLNIGDCLTFGSSVTELNSGDPKIRFPMLWHVIDKKDHKLKLLSYFCFEHTGYFPVQINEEKVTWENTSIREELNNTVYNKCFNENERKAILITEVKTKESDSSCIVTQDRLYVPSLEEIKSIPKHIMVGRTLISDHVDKDSDAVDLLYCCYWLRDCGEFDNTNLVVMGYSDSEIVLESLDRDSDEVGVRAVMWIDAEKF